MGRTDESSRQTRRTFLVATGTLVTAGCLDSSFDEGTDGDDRPTETGTPTDEGTDGESGTTQAETATATPAETATETPESHPFAGRTATITVENVEADRTRLERVLREAIAFWNDNHEAYLPYSTTLEYRPDAEDPDIVVSEVPEITECGVHEEGEFAGCATFLRPGDDDALPAEVELDPLPGDWAYRSVIKHELGHVLGLTHDDEPADLMQGELEQRYPEFEERMEILELRNEWVGEYNDAANALTDGFDAVETEEFDAAVEAFETADQHYAAAADLLGRATDLAAELSPFEPADGERLDAMLESERTFVADIRAAVETLRDGCERLARGEDGYETYNEGVDAYNAVIERQVPETSEYVDALGLSSVVRDAADPV